MDHNEPNWRINSSFSPPLPRRWDCRFHPDGPPRETNGTAIYGSSASSQSRGSRNGFSSEQYPNHHHSVSDGALSYYGSPSDNPQAPRWTPPVQRYDLGEFSTPSGASIHMPRIGYQDGSQRSEWYAVERLLRKYASMHGISIFVYYFGRPSEEKQGRVTQ